MLKNLPRPCASEDLTSAGALLRQAPGIDVRSRGTEENPRADECRLHSVSSQSVEAEVPAAGGRGRRALPRVRPGGEFPFAPKRKYTPCDAPKEKLFALRDFLGFDKNVIVQATCHDTDNRALVDALVELQRQGQGRRLRRRELHRRAAQGARPRRRQGRALQLHQAAGQFHAEGRDAADRHAHRQARLAHRDLFRARRSRRDGAVPEIAADHVGVRPHGLPGRRKRASTASTSRTG